MLASAYNINDCKRCADAYAAEGSAYDFTVQQYDQPVSLDKFRGKVTVILNIASA